jgi:hypothetical protein
MGIVDQQTPFQAQHHPSSANTSPDLAAAGRSWRERVFGSEINFRVGALEGRRLRLNLFLPDGAALREIGYYDTVDNIWTMDADRLLDLGRQFRLKFDIKYRILFMVLTPFEWLIRLLGKSARVTAHIGSRTPNVYGSEGAMMGGCMVQMVFLMIFAALLAFAIYLVPVVAALWLTRNLFMKGLKAEVMRLVRVGQYFMEMSVLALARDNSNSDASLADERAQVTEAEAALCAQFADLIAAEPQHRQAQ